MRWWRRLVMPRCVLAYVFLAQGPCCSTDDPRQTFKLAIIGGGPAGIGVRADHTPLTRSQILVRATRLKLLDELLFETTPGEKQEGDPKDTSDTVLTPRGVLLVRVLCTDVTRA